MVSSVHCGQSVEADVDQGIAAAAAAAHPIFSGRKERLLNQSNITIVPSFAIESSIKERLGINIVIAATDAAAAGNVVHVDCWR